MRLARISFDGLGDLIQDLEDIAALPDATAEAMLDAEADIVEEAQVYAGMKAGVYRTGATLSSIGRGRMKKGRGGERAKYVYPQGKNDKGVRTAEVAFINEYGAPDRGIAPRPFIGPANEEAADAAAEAAAKVYDDFLKSKNL